MEKSTPHCKLAIVKALVSAGQVRTTRAAREGGAALRFGFDDMLAVLLALTAGDFYKSMTTHADHRVWQDVYCWGPALRWPRRAHNWLTRARWRCT